MPFSGSYGPGRRGGTYPGSTVRGQRHGTSSTSGTRTERLMRCCSASAVLRSLTTPPLTRCGALTERPFALLDAARAGEKNDDPREPEDHALGRSRGGFGTKIHILCDAEGNPLHFHLSPGQTHDSKMLDTVLEGADQALHDDDGVALAWPLKLAGDKGYRADWIDQYLLDLGMTPVIPSKDNENRDERPVVFDKDALPAPEHRRVPHRLAQRVTPRRHPFREDRHQLRWHGQACLHSPLFSHLRPLTSFRTEPSNPTG